MTQTCKIEGYKELSESQIDLINNFKKIEKQMIVLINELIGNPDIDQRWLMIGKTNLQQGFMGIVRSLVNENE